MVEPFVALKPPLAEDGCVKEGDDDAILAVTLLLPESLPDELCKVFGVVGNAGKGSIRVVLFSVDEVTITAGYPPVT